MAKKTLIFWEHLCICGAFILFLCILLPLSVFQIVLSGLIYNLTYRKTMIINPPQLRKWYVTQSVEPSPYLSPEQMRRVVCGQVYGSHRPDGTWITTSSIKEVEYISGDFYYLHTQNTTYELGNPEPAFVKWLEENHPEVNIIKSKRGDWPAYITYDCKSIIFGNSLEV